MGIAGTIITGILLFIIAVNLVLAYILLIRYQRMMMARDTSRTVPRRKIPADWDRIMNDTTFKKGEESNDLRGIQDNGDQ